MTDTSVPKGSGDVAQTGKVPSALELADRIELAKVALITEGRDDDGEYETTDHLEPDDRYLIAQALRAFSSDAGVMLKRRNEADAYFSILQIIARFPITDPKNMDAVNMRLIAEGALAISSTHCGSGK